jgi:hypothetical protein
MPIIAITTNNSTNVNPPRTSDDHRFMVPPFRQRKVFTGAQPLTDGPRRPPKIDRADRAAVYATRVGRLIVAVAKVVAGVCDPGLFERPAP